MKIAAKGRRTITYGTGRYPLGRNIATIRKTIITASGRSRVKNSAVNEANVPSTMITGSSCHHIEKVRTMRLFGSNIDPLPAREPSWKSTPSVRLDLPAEGNSSPLMAASSR